MSGAADKASRRPPSPSGARRVVRVLGAYVLLAGAVSFLGWALDLPRLADWGEAGIAIQPNTTLAAMLAGLALLLIDRGHRGVAAVLGATVAVLGFATLVEHVLGVDLLIDTALLFDRSWGRRATLSPGRMGFPAAISWTIAGTALILQSGRRELRSIVPVCGIIVASIAMLSLTGYAFGADTLYTVPWLTAIARRTGTILLACGVALTAAAPEHQPMRGLLEDSGAGLLTRRTLPFIVAVPLVLGYLCVRGQKAGLYDTAMGTAMLVLSLIGLLATLLWWGARAVRRRERTIQRLNDRLRASVEELEGVFRAAPVGIAVARDRACRVVRINATLADMLGVAEGASAALGDDDGHERQTFRILDESGRLLPAAELPLRAAAARDEIVAGRTVVIRRADGTEILASGSAVPVGGSGDERGAIAVFRDVTAERHAATEREELLAITERARAEAERASNAKDEFLAVLSHELRSPLNAMMGWLRILRRTAGSEDVVLRALDTLERNVRAQAQVINDLLDISRITSGKLEIEHARCDLAVILAGAVETMRPLAADRHLALELAAPAEQIGVIGDAARLQQIVCNLLHNAIKFTPEDGRITVRLGARDGSAELEVEDDGQGIEPALLPHVFDRFVQSESSTTRRHGGLGLGLAIVAQLTALHGGTVRAASAGSGHGARFTVTLPSTSAPADPTAGAPRVVEPLRDDASPLRQLDLLLVEDDPDSREALAIALEQGGARVRCAASVRDALAAFSEHRPDVVVSDIGMPGEDGYTLIRAIRAREAGQHQRTVTIALTGFASRKDQEAALRAGFDEHLGKPVEPSVLLGRIAALIRLQRPESRSGT